MQRWLSDFISRRLAKGEARQIEKHRARFRTAPIGCWSQCVGTFGMIMDEAWEFRADGTGSVQQDGGEPSEIHFEWKPESDFCISCRITEWISAESDGEEMEEEEGPEGAFPTPWVTVRYDFQPRPTDVGHIVAMLWLDEDGTPRRGFWLSSEPLSHSVPL